MDGWLVPEGPHSPAVYWWRRLLVLVVAALVIWGIVAAAVSWWPSGQSVPTDDPSPTPTMTPTPAPTSTAEPSPSRPTTPQPSSTAPKPSATPTTPPAKPVIAACDPSDVRVTVAGKSRVQSGTETALNLSLINGSDATCKVGVNQGNYELVVTSGSDRIWTSKHCADWIGKHSATLKPEQALEWSVVWSTHRSINGCKISGDYLRPGTYVARAIFDGADPAAQVMVLYG